MQRVRDALAVRGLCTPDISQDQFRSRGDAP
jgi:hypothetical protein